ncbi:hypothetical protein F52700_6089 [Fusarium sp. NRRL 52700]|nr:hypothetical protein F52700_6089 [Fusarium sp. NRRL 52700]
MNMEDAALDLQLSRIISAVEQTTIFTTIVPKPTAQSEGTTTADSPVVTVTQESNSDNGSPGQPGTKISGALEIIIALGVLAGVLLLIMSIILCDRRRKSKRKRAAERSQNRMTDKSAPLEGPQQPSGAVLPEIKAGIKDNKLACNRVYLDMDSLNSQHDICTAKSTTTAPNRSVQMDPVGLISTIGAWQLAGLLVTHGLPAASSLIAIQTQLKERKAAVQKEMTYKEIQEAVPKILEIIEQKEIRLVTNEFNSTPKFISYFQAAAVGAVPLILLNAAQSIERIGASLDGIKDELAISNIAKVQGWADDGFGTYVHRFVRNEMAPVEGRVTGESHFFYVWNPDTDWYPDFERRQGEDPLGPNFGGYHHDLATICVRMRADRQALLATAEGNNSAVFHLIIPTYYPIVIDTPIIFATELFPLTITGSRHRGADLVWFDFNVRPRVPNPQLEFIGELPLAENHLGTGAAVTFLGSCLGCTASIIAAVAFPPCAPAAEAAFVSCWTTGFASGLVGNAAQIYEKNSRKEVQILGDVIFLN